jgi:hypothetical protein
VGDREGPLAHFTLHEDGRIEALVASGPAAPVVDDTGVLTGVSQGYRQWSEASPLTAETIRRARDVVPGSPEVLHVFHPLDYERYVEAGYIDRQSGRLNYDKIAEAILGALDGEDDTDG